MARDLVSAKPERLSVIVTNYNYAAFVGLAIESALALEWDDVEVIVVDDGSTDGSRAVIARYADQAQLLMLENCTQRVAAYHGFQLSTGDAVIFLDADDLLPAELPGVLAAVWSPEVTKVQFKMQRIDERGSVIGRPFPLYDPPPTPRQLREWLLATSAYPTPPGSGNVYSRWFLQRVLPAPASVGDFIDSLLLAAAPLMGDVVTVPQVAVKYRRHGANDSALLRDAGSFRREVVRARSRWIAAQSLSASTGSTPVEAPLFRSRELLQLRLAARRMTPAEDAGLPGDSRLRMALDSVRCVAWPGPDSLSRRAAIAAWSLAVAVAPSRAARILVASRYNR